MREAILVGLAGAVLLWPALVNGFPLIFSDTGTYISQVLEGHLGWDRPPFYSLYLALLGWGVTLWPPVIAQAIASAWLVRLVQRSIGPETGVMRYLAVTALLAAATSLPWTAARAMPDIFAPLSVLALYLIVVDAEADRRRRLALVLFLAGCVSVHLSILPLCVFLLVVIVAPLALAGSMKLRAGAAVVAVLLGVAALTSVNVLARGRFSPSPYAATFVLAREIANGPGRATLARDCPRAHWALCRYQAQLPHSADGFLWTADSPLYRAGGPRRLIGETDAILRRTILEHPGTVFAGAAQDFLRQLVMIRPATGLGAWPKTAGATIRRDLPHGTVVVFDHSLQARNRLVLSPFWARFDEAAEAGAMLICLFVAGRFALGTATPSGRRRGVLAALVLLALLANAAITGALSGPHDRYQSRIAWLPVMVAGFALGRRASKGADTHMAA